MAVKSIRKVAVIGAGVMGRGIAAHVANARIPVVLLDIVPPNPPEGQDTSDPEWRNSFAAGAIKKMNKEKPSPIFSKKDTSYITPGNTTDHWELIADCDWIVEAVPERMDIKKATFDKIEEHAHKDAIISSNTSGLSLAEMSTVLADNVKKRFLVTHFFNPVRYMKLLELIGGDETDPEVLETMARFGRDVLGKGIVYAKDTTNFIANRIGVHGMMSIMHTMSKYDLGVEDVDVIFGKPMGRPKSAVFRTADLVGLDTFVHVAKNCYDTLTDDEDRDIFQVPDFIHTMVEADWRGNKSGQGFYKKTKVDGKRVIQHLDLDALAKTDDPKANEDELYKPNQKPRFDSTGTRGTPANRIRGVLKRGEDKAADFAREVSLKSVAYAARHLFEIADDIVNVDRGMRWGFNWDMGPFETWDAVGIKWGYEKMQELGIDTPDWVKSMIDNDIESFYIYDGPTQKYYDPNSGEYREVPVEERERLSAAYLKRADKKIDGNHSATLYDMGDQVACLEFHTKMNAVDEGIISMIEKSLDTVEGGDWRGLVVANDSDNFSVGANLVMIGAAIMQDKFDDIESLINNFQQANQRLRYSSVPTVIAPAGMALGGGAEITLAGNRRQAAGELYIGLVEVGVGLIPGAGGNMMLMRNVFGRHADNKDADPLPFLQQTFMAIGTAQVATSAEEGREKGFLTLDDGVSMNRQHIMHDAKASVIGMSDSGFRPPRPTKFRLPGADGAATIDMLLYSMLHNGQISEYDRFIGKKLAHVLTGGDTTTNLLVDEQTLLDLEREVFLSLCGEEKTQARIQHMVTHNKPLRN